MIQSSVKWARWAVVAGTAGAFVYLALDDAPYATGVLLVGGLLLLGLNQLHRPEGDAFDRALRAQLIGFGLFSVALVVAGVGLLVGLIEGRNAEVAGVMAIAGGIVGVFGVRQGRRYFEAGGGGLAAIEVWKRDGLDAMRAYNEQRARDSEETGDSRPPPPDPSARISPP